MPGWAFFLRFYLRWGLILSIDMYGDRGDYRNQVAQGEYMPETQDFSEWLDISGLVFRIAKTERDIQAVYECRAKGYKRFGERKTEEWVDKFDTYATQYLCEEESSGCVVGVMRMISSNRGQLELQDFIKIPLLLGDGESLAENSRFSIPADVKRRSAVKMGLMSLSHLHAAATGHTHQVCVASPRLKPLYEMLLFSPYPGNPNCFRHPLSGALCTVMQLELNKARREEYRGHFWYAFTYEEKHANVIVDCK